MQPSSGPHALEKYTPQKYLEQKAFVKEFRPDTHNHLTSLEVL
jgi:hypothetical protein